MLIRQSMATTRLALFRRLFRRLAMDRRVLFWLCGIAVIVTMSRITPKLWVVFHYYGFVVTITHGVVSVYTYKYSSHFFPPSQWGDRNIIYMSSAKDYRLLTANEQYIISLRPGSREGATFYWFRANTALGYLILALVVALICRVYIVSKRMCSSDTLSCSRCGYSSAGLPSAVCPECGFVREGLMTGSDNSRSSR